MLAPTVGIKFKKCWTLARSNMRQCFRCFPIHFQRLIAISGVAIPTMGSRKIDSASLGLALLKGSVDGIQIIFAYKKNRQLMQCSKIHSLMPYAFFHGSFSVKKGRYAFLIFH